MKPEKNDSTNAAKENEQTPDSKEVKKPATIRAPKDTGDRDDEHDKDKTGRKTGNSSGDNPSGS